MLSRFARIKSEFGTVALLRILLMLVGSIAMAAGGYFGLETIVPAVTVALGLPLGWLLRNHTIEHFERLSWALPTAVIVYGIVMFVGEKMLRMSPELQLIVITAVTVTLFGIQFWTLSDPQIVNVGED